MLDALRRRADELEDQIVKSVAGGAESLREVWPHLTLAPGENTLARYAFFHALNEGRLEMGADRKLRVTLREDS